MLSSCSEEFDLDISEDSITFPDDMQAKIDAESNIIRLVFPGLDRRDTTGHRAYINRAIGRFLRDNPSKRIDYITTSYETVEIQSRLIASIASGAPYDAIYASIYDYPLYYTRQLTQPVDPYVRIDHMLGLTDGNGRPWLDINIMNQFFQFDGGHYLVVPYNSVYPFLTFYNKTMIDQMALDDPAELYRNNEWTVEAFHNLAVAATRDTDGTGINRTWGLSTSYENVWQSMNHTSMVVLDPVAGEYVLNFDDPALIRSLEYVQDAWHDRPFFNNLGTYAHETFMRGTHLFLFDPFWTIDALMREADNIPFEWSVVPMPFGTHNTARYGQVVASGISMVNGTRNPFTTAGIIEYIMQERTIPEHRDYEIPREYLTMRDDLVQRPFTSGYYDSLLTSLGRALLQSVRNGRGVAWSLEHFRPEFQSDLDDANRVAVFPEPRRHEPYLIDFEDENILEYILPLNSTPAGVEFSIVTGEYALDGRSLMISFPQTETNDTRVVRLFALSGERYPLYGFNTYRVTFDYRVIGDLAGGVEYGVGYVIIDQDGGMRNSGPLTPFEPEAGERRTAEIIMSPVANETATFAFAFGGSIDGASIIIDNLSISQVE